MSVIQSQSDLQGIVSQNTESAANPQSARPPSHEIDVATLGFTPRELEPIFVADEPFAPEIQPKEVPIEGQLLDPTTEAVDEAAEQEPKSTEGSRSGPPGAGGSDPARRAAANDFWDHVAHLAHTYSGQKRHDAVPLAIATAATQLSADAAQKAPAHVGQQVRPASDVSTWTTGPQIAAENQTASAGESALHARYDRAKQAEKVNKYLEAQAKEAATVAFGTRGSAVRAASGARG